MQQNQPPSGGCVLKHIVNGNTVVDIVPAAFGRLRVETTPLPFSNFGGFPAAFGRLRVETLVLRPYGSCPATSRLRAAAC